MLPGQNHDRTERARAAGPKGGEAGEAVPAGRTSAAASRATIAFEHIALWVPVAPTEDRQALGTAVARLFPGISPEYRDGWLVGDTTDPSGLREGVRRSATADAVTAHMLGVGRLREHTGKWRSGFLVNKQAAMAGRLHIGDEGAALGDIQVEAEFSGPPDREALLEWFLVV